MATRTDVDASVGYYGVGIENDLGEAGNIRKPLLLHVAEKDKFVPPEAQKTVREALERNPQVTIYRYPNCDHAFARVGGEHYDKEAADAANRRTLDFFNLNLKV
jgi:carboxymethylenebutenolidase